jgi:hypothetical protein
MPDAYNGSAQGVEQLAEHRPLGDRRQPVANNPNRADLRAAARQEPGTGKRIDYHGLSRVLEEKIRARYES